MSQSHHTLADAIPLKNYGVKIPRFKFPTPSPSADYLLKNVSLTLNKGKCSVIMGKSGCGKSTLLRLIAGLIDLPKGAQRWVPQVNGRDNIAVMSQDHALMPWLTVTENVMIGRRLRGEKPNKDYAHTLLSQVNLYEYRNHYPKSLSGGMRQRTCLARTLYEEAEIVLMDEPFNSLDALTRLEIQNIFKNVFKSKTSLFITHDPREALSMGNDIFILQDGNLTLQNSPSVSSLFHTLGAIDYELSN